MSEQHDGPLAPSETSEISTTWQRVIEIQKENPGKGIIVSSSAGKGIEIIVADKPFLPAGALARGFDHS